MLQDFGKTIEKTLPHLGWVLIRPREEGKGSVWGNGKASITILPAFSCVWIARKNKRVAVYTPQFPDTVIKAIDVLIEATK